VPIGTKDKIFQSLDELDAPSALLKRATILHSDFESILSNARQGDFVFADPPYFERKKNVRFLKYNSDVFGWSDQLRLRSAILQAAERGATCFVTNANHRSLLDLYKGCGKIHKLSRHSVLSGPAHGRGVDREILVEIR
jgi:DNA adenine methylase